MSSAIVVVKLQNLHYFLYLQSKWHNAYQSKSRKTLELKLQRQHQNQ